MDDHGVRYFKGHSKKDSRMMIFEIYDEPQETFFDDETVQAIASAIEKTGMTDYATIEECEQENYIEREISQAEYRSYRIIQRLLTEMFLNQYTGGFPRQSEVNRLMRELPRSIAKWQTEIGG